MRPFAPGTASITAALLLAACDSGPTDPFRAPDGQLVPTTCEASNTFAPEVGATVERIGAWARYFCLDNPGGESRDFTIVLSSSREADLAYATRFETFGVGFSPPAPVPARLAPETRPVSRTSSARFPDEEDFHARLRAWELEELGPRVLAGGVGSGTAGREAGAPAVPAAIPSVGTVLSFNAQANRANLDGGACDLPLPVSARVEAVSNRAIVVADLQNPPGGFTASDYARYAAQFDTLLAPVAEAHFGTPSDIDGNGQRTILLFTKEVNRLTPPSASAFTAGFFFARDLFPRQRQGALDGCAHSNEAEILYLMVPDPNGVYGKEHLRFFIDQLILSTIIHEYQHLINASRRLFLRGAPAPTWQEAPWLNEALSHLAEELLFHRVAGLGPRRNIDTFVLSIQGTPQAFDALQRHQRLNFERFFAYLETPETTSPFDSGLGLRARGASWNFLRYLADRSGPDQSTFLRSLVDSDPNGFDNLARAVGSLDLVHERLADWRVALFADDRIPGLEDRHRDLSWHLPRMHDLLGQGGYPLRTRPLESGGSDARTLLAGGASYLRIEVPPAATGVVQVTVNGALPPADLRVTVLRIP